MGAKKQKKSLNRSPRKYPRPLKGTAVYGNMKNKEFVWEFKQGFVKAVVGKAVCFRERPLRELRLCM